MSDSTSVSDLGAEINCLRRKVAALLVMLLIATLVPVFLLYATTRQQAAAISRQAPTVALIEKQEVPKLQAIVTEFQAYGARDPGFVPILTRLNLKPAAAASLIPAPAQAPSVKK